MNNDVIKNEDNNILEKDNPETSIEEPKISEAKQAVEVKTAPDVQRASKVKMAFTSLASKTEKLPELKTKFTAFAKEKEWDKHAQNFLATAKSGAIKSFRFSLKLSQLFGIKLKLHRQNRKFHKLFAGAGEKLWVSYQEGKLSQDTTTFFEADLDKMNHQKAIVKEVEKEIEDIKENK